MGKTDYRLDIAGVEYGADRIELESLKITRELFPSFGIGNASAASMEVRILPTGEPIPRSAKIKVYSGDSALGTFYIDTRRVEDGWMSLSCYDGMLKYDRAFPGTGVFSLKQAIDLASSTVELTMEPATYVMASECGAMLRIDGHTVREVFSQIAVCLGGNFIVSERGSLRLVPLTGNGTAEGEATSPPASGIVHDRFVSDGDDIVISGIRLSAETDDGTAEYFTGDESGYVLSADCTMIEDSVGIGRSEVCSALYDSLVGAVFRPFSLPSAVIGKDGEAILSPGDRFTLYEAEMPIGVMGEQRFNLMRWEGKRAGEDLPNTDPVYILGRYSVVCGACIYGSVGMAGDDEVSHEYPYLPRSERQLRSVRKTASSAQKTAAAAEQKLAEHIVAFEKWKAEIEKEIAALSL